MAREQENKAIVGRWFKDFWGNPWNPGIVDELAAPDMLLQYSLHAPRRGREDIKNFMTGFREAFPDLGFGGAADLIAEGDFVVGRLGRRWNAHWSRLRRLPHRSPPAGAGRRMQFTGTTVLRVENGRIAEEIGLDHGVPRCSSSASSARPDRAQGWVHRRCQAGRGPGRRTYPVRRRPPAQLRTRLREEEIDEHVRPDPWLVARGVVLVQDHRPARSGGPRGGRSRYAEPRPRLDAAGPDHDAGLRGHGHPHPGCGGGAGDFGRA